MATNKNALVRYRILDQCFADPNRYYTLKQLHDKVDSALYDMFDIHVCERQIKEDIRVLRNRPYLAPIIAKIPPVGVEVNGRERIYKYSEEGFSIYNSQLTLEETEKLKSVVDMLRRFSGLPHFEWIDDLIIRLDDEFQLSGTTEHIIGFEQNPQLKGLEFLSRLIEFATKHQVIKAVQHSYRSGLDSEVILHPYFIKQYNSRWFLFGRLHPEGKIYNLPIDRIRSLAVADGIPFIPKWNDIDFEHYFDNVVGVSVPREKTEPSTILIKVDPKEYPFLESKPIHKSQQLVDSENCIIQIKAIPNYELDHQIIAYGSALEVISPEPYRQRIMDLVQNIYKKYFPGKFNCPAE